MGASALFRSAVKRVKTGVRKLRTTIKRNPGVASYRAEKAARIRAVRMLAPAGKRASFGRSAQKGTIRGYARAAGSVLKTASKVLRSGNPIRSGMAAGARFARRNAATGTKLKAGKTALRQMRKGYKSLLKAKRPRVPKPPKFKF